MEVLYKFMDCYFNHRIVSIVNAESPEELSYTDCQGTCGPERNCRLATCGVVSGTGGRGCGG